MTPSVPWEIRRATGSEALAVAAVHIGSWRVAYRGIMHDDFLDGLDMELRASRYKFDLTNPGDPVTFVAVDAAKVVGLVIVGPTRDEDLTGLGEVCALYVEPDQWRSGVGSALMKKAEQQLTQDGFTEASLWVLEGNFRGRGFYEATGWRTDGQTRSIEIGGSQLVEVRYLKELTSRTT